MSQARICEPLAGVGQSLSAVVPAVRQAGWFQQSMISPAGGAIAAAPVALVLGAAMLAGNPLSGVTMSTGAMLVGILWRFRGGWAFVGLMASDAAVMASATYLGCVTASMAGLHLLVLAVLSPFGGMLIALGPGNA